MTQRKPRKQVTLSSLEVRDITDPAMAKAIGHPLRLKILNVLDTGTASPSQIAKQLDERLATVSYHVRKLSDLKLIELVDSKPRRGAVEHYYRTSSRWIVSDKAWGELPKSIRHVLAQEVLDQISDDLNGAEFNSPRDHLSRTRLQLDEQGQADVAKVLRATLTQIHQAAEESRLRSETAVLQEIEVAMMSFRPAPE